MKRRRVELSEEARADLIALYDWIAEAAGPATALSWTERLEGWCMGFELASERGHLREDIRPGLRIVGFERRVTVALVVEDDRVIILRVFYAGRNWEDTVV